MNTSGSILLDIGRGSKPPYKLHTSHHYIYVVIGHSGTEWLLMTKVIRRPPPRTFNPTETFSHTVTNGCRFRTYEKLWTLICWGIGFRLRYLTRTGVVWSLICAWVQSGRMYIEYKVTIYSLARIPAIKRFTYYAGNRLPQDGNILIIRVLGKIPGRRYTCNWQEIAV